MLLPGFAFKAVVIGGGYATGRELASFFLPSGPRGGLYAMLLSMVIWSVVCALTFLFAHQTNSLDYRSFFRRLLGRFWPAFEIAWVLALLVILAVYAAAAGAIGQAVMGWVPLVGSLLLVAAVILVAVWGNDAVEGLFKYVTFFLYGTYLMFVVVGFTHFGDRSIAAIAADTPTTGWFAGGLTYAGYNIIGAVVILPVVRHIKRRRDALIAGLLAGPMAMLPAFVFFVCMVAFYPEIANEPLPSDYLLEQMHWPAFRIVFQLMIFAALLESSTGGVHAINERIAHAAHVSGGRSLSTTARLISTCAVLGISIFVAARFGLVALIARGYLWLSFAFLAIYVFPLVTLGLWRILRPARADAS